LQAYLFRAFIRRINKTLKRRVLVENAVRFLFLDSRNSTDPWEELERKMLIDELLTRDRPSTRDMFYRRSHGLLWDDIAPFYGISAHAAESRFSQALKRIRGMLGLEEEEEE
jgi:DNA-directed RNA polymerase specialized sigma24 family protein